MNGAIQLQPFLAVALQALFAVVTVLAIPVANKLYDLFAAKLNLQGNATAHSIIDGVVQDAIPYAKTYANTALTKVGPIDTGNPTIAAAANFILSHAPDELAQLGFTEQHVIELVRSAIQQSSTPEKTS